MTPLAAFALTACLAIDAPNDRIVAGDLARGLPEWAAVPPETPVALAPAPGVQRVLRFAELRRLAAQRNIPADPATELCFARPVAPVPPERMLQVMRTALPGARIEIVEPSRVPAPQGTLEFPITGLRLGLTTSGYWFGHVTYAAGRRFIVWARVNVSVPVQRIVASADLKPGEPIDPSQLKVESSWGKPPAGPGLSMEEIAGHIPKRAIPAGTAIEKHWLGAPLLVQRGDTVRVEVISGATKLETTAVAEAAGTLGDLISVQNPDSKRRFRARVEAKGRVSVKSIL